MRTQAGIRTRVGAVLVALGTVVTIAPVAMAQQPSAPNNGGGPPITEPTEPSTAPKALLVSGYVRLPGGAPIEGATVSGSDLGSVLTDANGFYELQFVNFGTYTVTATKPGMDSESKVVTLNVYYTNINANFHLRFLTTASLNRSDISTATGPFALTLTLATYAPASSCARVTDSRTGSTASVALVAGEGTLASGTWASDLAQDSPEGAFTLAAQVTTCSTGTQIDTGATANYVVDNTAPVLRNPLPAHQGNSTSSSLSLGVFAVEPLSGVAAGSVRLTLDGAVVAPGAVTLQGVVGGTSILHPANLSRGFHTVTAEAADKAGNAAAPLSWRFLVTTLSLPTATAEPDPTSTASVPIGAAPGDPLPVPTSLRVGHSLAHMETTAHAGFGTLCGRLDLSTLRARFQKVDGSSETVAPTNLGPPVRYACTHVSAVEPDSTDSYWLLAHGMSYGAGDLEYRIPLGATPGSPVTTIFEAANNPAVQWQAPCPRANAAAGTGSLVPVPVCDPIANWIDSRMGSTIAKHLASRSLNWDSQGYALETEVLMPSVWKDSGGRWIPVAPPLDLTMLQPTDVSSTTPLAGPYSDNPSAAVLYRVFDRWVKETLGGGGKVALGSYFEWGPEHTGNPDHASYVSASWAGGQTREQVTYELWDRSGNPVARTIDDSGASVARLVFDDAERGVVVGFTDAFASGAATGVVSAGQVDVIASASSVCDACTVASQWFGAPTPEPQGFAASGSAAGIRHVGPADSSQVVETNSESATVPRCVTVPPTGVQASSSTEPTVCRERWNWPDPEPDAASWSDSYYLTHDRVFTAEGGDWIRNQGRRGQNKGAHVFFVGRPCLTGDPQEPYGVTLFKAGSCTRMQRVLDEVWGWFNGYAENETRLGTVRLILATNNSYEDPIVPDLEGIGRDMYGRMWRTLGPHADDIEDWYRSQRDDGDPETDEPWIRFTISGGNDIETPNDDPEDGSVHWQDAADTLPWVIGWNRQADDDAGSWYQMNMYSANSLTFHFQCPSRQDGESDASYDERCWRYRGTERNPALGGGAVGWSAQDLWLASYGHRYADFDQDYSAPQNYARVRPPYYSTLNDFVRERGHLPHYQIAHSAVLWDCTQSSANPDPDYAGRSDLFYSSAQESYGDFVAPGRAYEEDALARMNPPSYVVHVHPLPGNTYSC